MRFCVAKVEEVQAHKSKAFSISLAEKVLEGFLVCHDREIYAYVNQCPHTGVNLNWSPDVFLSADQQYIQCAMHGALFRMEDGFCVRGPCVNQSLQPLPVVVENGQVWLSMSSF